MGFKKSQSLRESVLRKTLKRSDKRDRRKRLTAEVAKLKLEFENALRLAEMARTSAEMNRTAAEEAQTAAEKARTTAEKARTAAEMCRTYAEKKRTALRTAEEALAAANKESKISQSEELTQPSHQESSNAFHGLSAETVSDLLSGQSEPSSSGLRSSDSGLIKPTVPPNAGNAVLSTQLTLSMNAMNVSTSE